MYLLTGISLKLTLNDEFQHGEQHVDKISAKFGGLLLVSGQQ